MKFVSRMMSKYTVVMVRHGESEWNKKNLFCGWFDAELSDRGLIEAKNAGALLKKAQIKLDKVFTSVLRRTKATAETILAELNRTGIPIEANWRLNERHYGALTGLNKVETAAKYGNEQVAIWRRSFDVPPPPMDKDHPYYTSIFKDDRYSKYLREDEIPTSESLKLTIQRVLPFWNGTIVPEIKNGSRIMIVAHGSSLRGIVTHLDNLSDDQIMDLNLPTGIPFTYTLDDEFKPIPGRSMQFFGDPCVVKKAMETVANQARSNASMHHAGIQYGQEHMSANHLSAQQQQQIQQQQQLQQQSQQLQQQYNGSDLSVQPGVSTTASLRQWRKKEPVVEKQLPADANSKEPIARVAPHAHYPRPSELYPYPSQYPEYGMQYKDMASTTVKYSEIVEPAAHHLTHPAIQKPKDKEFLEMCSMQQSQMKHSYPMMPQYVHKESQMHYIPKEPTFPSPYHMQNYKMTNQYQRQYPNEFQLALFNERHIQEPQLYQQNMDQRMYQNQRMYRLPNYRPQALNPTYQSFNYKPNVQNPDSYRMHPYQQNMQNYKIPTGHDPISRNLSPRRVYPDNLNYRQSPNNYNCNQLEYAQHYQNRRIVPDYTTSKYPQMPDIVPESNAKSSLKQYLENWNDDIPDIQEADDKRLKDNSLYILDSTEIPTENIQQFIHLHVDKLPENIKGYISSNVIKPSPDPLNLTQETVIQDSKNSSPQISVISETKKSHEQNTVIVYNNDNKPEASAIKPKQKIEGTEDILNEDLLSEGLNLKTKANLEMLDKALEFDDSQSDELKSLEDEIIEHYNNSVGSTNEEELKNAQEMIGEELMQNMDALKSPQYSPENQSEINEEKPKDEVKPIKSETSYNVDDLLNKSQLEHKLEEETKEETPKIISDSKEEIAPINEEKKDLQFDTKSIQTEEKEEQLSAPISLESKLIQTESNSEKIIKDGAKIMKNIAMQTDTEKQLKPNSEPSIQYLNLITNDNHLLVQIAGEILEIKVLNSVGKKFISVVSFTDCNIIAENNNNNNSLEQPKSYELLPDLNLESSVINEIEISGEEMEVLDVKMKKDEYPKLEVKEETAKIDNCEFPEVKTEAENCILGEEVEVPLVDEIFEEANGDVNKIEEINLNNFELNEGKLQEIETVSKDADFVTDAINIESTGKKESNDLSEKEPIIKDLSISNNIDDDRKVCSKENIEIALKELESSSIVKEIVEELQDKVVSPEKVTKELTNKETKKRPLESSPTEKVHKKRKLSSSYNSKDANKVTKSEEHKSETENKSKCKLAKKRSLSDSIDVKNELISKPLEAKFFSSKHNFSIIPKRDSPVIKSSIPLNKKLTYLAEPTSIQKSPVKEAPVKEIIKEPIKVKTKAELKETSPVKPVKPALKITNNQPDSGKKRLSLEEYKRKRTVSDSEDLKKSATTAIPKLSKPIVKETQELSKTLYEDIKTDFEDTLNRILDSKIREEGLDCGKPSFVCDSSASKQNDLMTATRTDNKFVCNTKTKCRLAEVIIQEDKCDVVNNSEVHTIKKPKLNEPELLQSTDGNKMDDLAKKIDDIFSQTFGKNRQCRTAYKKLNLNLDTLNPFGPNKVREIINLDEISEDLKRNQTRTNHVMNPNEVRCAKIDKDLFSLEDSRLESVENRSAIIEKPLPSALKPFEESRNKILKLEERMLRKTVICQFDETKSEQVQSTNELIKDLETSIAEIDESKVTVDDSIENPEESKDSEVEVPKSPERCESGIKESVIELVEVSESAKCDVLDLKLDEFSAITIDEQPVAQEVEIPVLRGEEETKVAKEDETVSSPVNCSIPTCEVDFPTLEMIMCKIPQPEEEMPVLSPQVQKHSRSLSINDISKKLMDICTKDMYAKDICMKDKPTYIRYDSEDLKLYLKKIPTAGTEVQKQRRQRRKKRFRNLHSAESEPEDSASLVKDYSVFESKNQKGLPKLIIKRNVCEGRDNNLQPVVRLERNPILDHLAKRKRKL